VQRTRPRLLHGTLINRYGFTGHLGRPFGDTGIGHLRGTTGRFSSHHVGNGRAVTGTIIGTRARNRRPVTLTVPGEGLCDIGPIP
jgi:hypothetical protein